MKSFIVLIFVCWSVISIGQRDFLLYTFDGLAQSHYVNPSFRPNSKVFVAMPALNQNLSLSHSGFQFNDLVSIRTADDSLVLSPATAIEKMTDVNFLNTEVYNELLSFGFAIGEKSYLNFSVTNKLQTRFSYPRDLFKFVFEGNGKDFLGQRASFDGLGIDVFSSIDVAVGFNKDVTEKLRVGGRVKYIKGLGTLYTRRSELGIYTDATTFDLTVDGSMEVNSSGTGIADGTISPFSVLANSNRGLGLDLGVSYQLTDKIGLSASVIDLGFVNWKEDTRNFVSNDANFVFEGVDLELFLSDSSDVIDLLVDSLEQEFTYSEQTESFNTPLYTRWFVGGTFQSTEKLTLGGLLFGELIRGDYRLGASVSANLQIAKWFSLAGNYSYFGSAANNIGLGFAINGGPIQLYAMSDNALGFVMPQASKNWHARFGMNLIFGRDKKEKEQKASYE